MKKRIIMVVPGKVRPANLSSIEFERLYKFFENVFERECPEHSEQIVHAYVMGQIEIIKAARELKEEKVRLNDYAEYCRAFEQGRYYPDPRD